jgi:hypothetical protein
MFSFGKNNYLFVENKVAFSHAIFLELLAHSCTHPSIRTLEKTGIFGTSKKKVETSFTNVKFCISPKVSEKR